MNENNPSNRFDRLTLLAAGICFSIFVIYILWPSARERVDEKALILFFGAVACLLLPMLTRVKLGELLELETRFAKTADKISQLIHGEVVITEKGGKFFIDRDGLRYSLPDRATTQFLTSARGEIPVTETILHKHQLVGEMDSVLSCKVLRVGKEGQHLFVLLKNKKYHIPSWAYLMDWGRDQEERNFVKLEPDAFREIPLGK